MEWLFHTGNHKNDKDLWQGDNKTPRPNLDETKIKDMDQLLVPGVLNTRPVEK
ncbi:hypothetical protein [Bacillus sp. ISL-77]|uniref:hypothetical protein n=1 Tax=Bacillus sp. ISL-77 TaxID=2819138 RepID=UPI001BE54DE2|nr:hypothetical protein [Bacillus sp. ISL-77]MBT2742609.1 hypothetical protein [Bacillus sp. ISL-77]